MSHPLRRLTRQPARMLASVTSVREAELAFAGGADIIDCKDPARGALGALDVRVVAAIRARLPEAVISATIGDLPARADVLVPEALAMAATGVDYVKVGFFPGGEAAEAIRALGKAFPSPRLVGVLLADREPDFALIPLMAAAGFAAVLIDTAGKDGRSLPDIMSPAALAKFIGRVHSVGRAAGLAGSLRPEHLPGLLDLGADIVGFRGALCIGSDRTAAIDQDRVARVRAAFGRDISPAARRLEELST